MDSVPFSMAMLGACAISSVYVIGIHVFSVKNQPRNNPRVIKSRMVGATAGTIAAMGIYYKYFAGNKAFITAFGLTSNTFKSISYSLVLIATLFAGPILQSFMDPEDSFSISFDLKSLRNLLFAPITEELVYRASIIPILYPYFPESKLLFYCPLFFGTAHLHHLYEKIYILRMPQRNALIYTLFQLGYQFLER